MRPPEQKSGIITIILQSPMLRQAIKDQYSCKNFNFYDRKGTKAGNRTRILKDWYSNHYTTLANVLGNFDIKLLLYIANSPNAITKNTILCIIFEHLFSLTTLCDRVRPIRTRSHASAPPLRYLMVLLIRIVHNVSSKKIPVRLNVST